MDIYRLLNDIASFVVLGILGLLMRLYREVKRQRETARNSDLVTERVLMTVIYDQMKSCKDTHTVEYLRTAWYDLYDSYKKKSGNSYIDSLETKVKDM